MNLKHLFYFWKTARSGGVVKAGEALHITPQTISGQIRLLEESLDTQLFARDGRALELTPAGRLARRRPAPGPHTGAVGGPVAVPTQALSSSSSRMELVCCT